MKSPIAFSAMSTATYRGASYDTDLRHINQLALIKKQLEKAQARHLAELNMAKK